MYDLMFLWPYALFCVTYNELDSSVQLMRTHLSTPYGPCFCNLRAVLFSFCCKIYCRQALTEVSVLSDVLQIVHNHHQYLSLDPVYVNKKYTLPPSYQYQIKKKALDVASKILRKGAEPFKRLSSQTDHKFYRALYDLRRRWILRRTANGVSGDLSYRS
uniref:Uncharacterized protein n=2 Tax=Amphimedon queenslandica TaxID=400682 RepID=A0A1X7SL46_AMPQE